MRLYIHVHVKKTTYNIKLIVLYTCCKFKCTCKQTQKHVHVRNDHIL